MAAHLRELPRCDAPSCDRTATHALHNTFNALCGYYCARHARRALNDFQRAQGEEADE